jgi:hypothetical protein
MSYEGIGRAVAMGTGTWRGNPDLVEAPNDQRFNKPTQQRDGG